MLNAKKISKLIHYYVYDINFSKIVNSFDESRRHQFNLEFLIKKYYSDLSSILFCDFLAFARGTKHFNAQNHFENDKFFLAGSKAKVLKLEKENIYYRILQKYDAPELSHEQIACISDIMINHSSSKNYTELKIMFINDKFEPVVYKIKH